MFDIQIGVFKIVAISKATSRESVPHCNSSSEDALMVTPHQWNLKGMMMGRFYISDMVGPNCNSLD